MTTSVTFGSASGDRQCISIPILTDDIEELPEDFNVVLNLPDPARPDVRPGMPPTARVVIIGETCVPKLRPFYNTLFIMSIVLTFLIIYVP